jgi:hypothetical protein
MKINMNNKEKEHKIITFDQLKEIMLDDIKYFPEVVKNVFCSNCLVTEVVDYIIYLDQSGYVLLDGSCKKCGKHVARLIETNEDPPTAKRAKRIYKTIK